MTWSYAASQSHLLLSASSKQIQGVVRRISFSKNDTDILDFMSIPDTERTCLLLALIGAVFDLEHP